MNKLGLCLPILLTLSALAEDPGKPALSPPPPGTHFEFGGVFGDRVKADVENWLIPAPKANPGMIDMFYMRDRKPVPDLVPWAGEFVGKYLISAIQALRMSDSKELRATVEDTIHRLIAAQDEDGYLGPFRHEERLLGHWDLWGHYHIILALLMWHDETGDQPALDCAKKMGDFICKVYLNTDKRPINAGSEEMNLAIIHGMGRLYRETHEQRYLDLMRVVEEDWKKAGDYFQQGLAGVPFYKLPRPRWESLHDLQGLGELYRITGNEDYKTAYVNLWKSIKKYDRHNTGGFSTGEQAIGNPFTPGAIETCCTTAWCAITKDILELTGDPEAADELELSLYNSVLGSQHPSGRWFTYNTPMDGKREASAHTIVFQSRAGTPELNCCSVNGPRGLGMVSEWAVMMRDENTLQVNYLGPMKATIPMHDGNVVTLSVEGNYPTENESSIAIKASETGNSGVKICVRYATWPDVREQNRCHMFSPKSSSNLEEFTLELGGQKHSVQKEFKSSIAIQTVTGDGDKFGKVSIYLGPILLAFDQRDNNFDVAQLLPFDWETLNYGHAEAVTPAGSDNPIRLVTLEDSSKRKVVFRDFASAGATGSEYVTWLPVKKPVPPVPLLDSPTDGARIPLGTNRFTWSGAVRPEGWSYNLTIAEDVAFTHIIYTAEPTRSPWCIVTAPLEANKTYFWCVSAKNDIAQTVPLMEPTSNFRFTIDPSLKNDFIDNPATYEIRSDNLIAGDYLDGKPAPVYGYVDTATGVTPTPDRNGKADGALAFNGHDGMLRYRTPGFPGDNYTVSLWFRADGAQPHLAQVFSAWSKGGDDPLRIVIDKDKVFARIEGNSGANSKGAPVVSGQWMHAAAVKSGGTLKFFVNGELIDTTGAPGIVPTMSKDIALGSNPHHTGDEHFAGAIDDFALYARALSDDEVKALAAGTLKLETTTAAP